MHTARMIVATTKATSERRNGSAMIIPSAAMTAKPTNGWRGPFRNFIVLLFLYFTFVTQALIRGDRGHDAGFVFQKKLRRPSSLISATAFSILPSNAQVPVPEVRDECYVSRRL